MKRKGSVHVGEEKCMWMKRITCTRVDKGNESLIDFHIPKIPICHLIKACMCLDRHMSPYMVLIHAKYSLAKNRHAKNNSPT
jgi:hypothetical protein